LGSLSPTRDFNFVADTCSAFLTISECDAAIGHVINSASNFEVSIADTAMLIGDIMNVNIELVSDYERLRPDSSEVNRLFGDNQLLRDLTSWEPSYGGLAGFRRGLSITAEWFSNPTNLARYSPSRYCI
jgi:nucleoside-diphosphate-sugar epimerase